MAHRATDDRRVVGLLVAIGVVASNLLMVCMWLWWAFGTHNGFADMSVDTLKDPYVREAIAEQIVEAMQEGGMTEQFALVAGPALTPVVAEVVKTDAFRAMFYASARHLHEVIFSGARSSIRVEVNDADQMARDSLAVVNPELARKLPPGAIDIAVGLSQNRGFYRIIDFASITGFLLWPLGAVVLGSFAAALVTSRDRRGTVLRMGLGLAGSGLFWIVTLIVGVAVVSRFVDGAADRAALRAVFRSVTHVLMLTAKVVLCGGLVIAMAALAAGEQRVRARMTDAYDWSKDKWNGPRLHGVLGAAVVMVGVLIAAYPEVLAAMVARTLGLVLAFIGLVAVLDVVGARAWADTGDGHQAQTVRRVALFAVSASIVLTLLSGVGGLALYNAMHTRTPSVASASGCNGSEALCERRLDQVVFAGTHNSMAAASAHFFFPRHRGGIAAQLAKGIRAFLIDVHYGCRTGNIVRTDYGSPTDAAEARDELNADQAAVLDRTLATVGFNCPPEQDRELFLCHLFCELGATPAVEGFAQFYEFLRFNPGEVIIILIEEDFTEADDLEAAIHESRLDRRAFEYQPDVALPTLGEMTRSGRTALLMTETHLPTQPWLTWAFGGALKDTPYTFDDVSEFNCWLNRGAITSRLLLANHWLNRNPASPAAAAVANEKSEVIERAIDCRSRWGQLPTIIAVDFYDRGDLVDAVNYLNGLEPWN